MTVQIRRCEACGEPAVVVVRAFRGALSFVGLDLGETGTIERRELACQACGARFTIDAPERRNVPGCLGVLICAPFALLGVSLGVGGLLTGDLVRLVVFAVGVLLSAAMIGIGLWWREPRRLLRALPIVGDAPMPTLRFGALEEPRRVCTCGGDAAVVLLTEHTSHGIGQGRTTRYRCAACQREFELQDTRGVGLGVLGTAVFVGLGYLGITHSAGHGWFAWLCSGGVGLFGLAGGVATAVAIVTRLRHPVV